MVIDTIQMRYLLISPFVFLIYRSSGTLRCRFMCRLSRQVRVFQKLVENSRKENLNSSFDPL